MTDKLIGTVLDGRYTIKEIIGTGGMSIVYRAEDALEDRSVAIKVLKEEFISDQTFRRRFLNESRAIAMLSHPNIVDVVDVNFEGSVQYIVMEHIEGRTIKDYIAEKGALPVDEALGYCKQILRALEHAHERGVVHRDIKSQNIMLLADGTVKVTDFGIAHVACGDTVTMTDLAIGSVHYISPEQARGHQTDEKSDLYSTGIVLYEMITGQLPFEADTAVSVALMQVQQKPRRASEVVAGIDPGLDEIIIHAMQKLPADRYQHASEMLSDIEKYENDHSVVFDYAVPEDDGSTILMPKVEEQKDMNKKKKKKKMSRARFFRAQNRVLSFILGVALAVCLIVLGVKAMDYWVEALVTEYVEVPYVIGENVDYILSRYNADKNFEFEYEYTSDAETPYGTILSQSPDPGKTVASDKQVTVTLKVSSGPQTTTVPSVVGLPLADAKVRLTQSSLTYTLEYREDKTKSENTVLMCTPEPGSDVVIRSAVTLVVSVKSVEHTVSVPSVVGTTNTEAAQKIVEAGLIVARKTVYSDTYPAGYVISQTPSPTTVTKEKVEPGSTVTLYISQGPYPKEEPVVPSEGGEEVVSSGAEEPVTSSAEEPVTSGGVE